MQDREVMQMALDALKQTRVFVTTREKIKHPEGTDWYDYTIEALRAQLEQGEQEPVADGIQVIEHVRNVQYKIKSRYHLENGTELYTAPPQREWQGLTDEEIKQAYCEWDGFARAIEAKLKEKNT